MNDLDRLRDTIDELAQFIAALPAHVLTDQAWGAKEVLAHLVYHHELYVRLAKASVAGVSIDPPKGRFRELNARAVAANRGVSPAALVTRLRKANQRLEKIYQTHDPNEIVVEIKSGAKPRTLAELVPEVEAHIRNHLRKLRKESWDAATGASLEG